MSVQMVFIWMLIDSLIYFVVGWYFRNILPSEYGEAIARWSVNLNSIYTAPVKNSAVSLRRRRRKATFVLYWFYISKPLMS